MNEDLAENQVKIKLKNSDRLRRTGAQYINFFLEVDSKQTIKNNFDLKKDDEEFILTMDVTDIDKFMSKEFAGKQILFRFKKKRAMFYSVNIGEEAIKLNGLAMKSTMKKDIKLDGAPLGVEISIHKAIRGLEFDQIEITKTRLGLIPAPFKTI